MGIKTYHNKKGRIEVDMENMWIHQVVIIKDKFISDPHFNSIKGEITTLTHQNKNTFCLKYYSTILSQFMALRYVYEKEQKPHPYEQLHEEREK